MPSIFIESIGIIAGTLGVLAWIPQIKEVWIKKKHEGISLPTLHLICTALLLWLIYGFMIKSVAIVISNLAALSCILSLIVGVIRLRDIEI
ncbi:MAG: SemiSWEET family sugar transporter [Candidatus Poseidoniales archaeon]|jgi:MtN3 and saliva related transmembrane protein|nr:SemiSWEET family transporter [Candidatus Thalassarchaeaceae archaeon]|tara:strand:- start:284 stop:556 length:273 start_codon:yes stop_codon:yes gene_type:complete